MATQSSEFYVKPPPGIGALVDRWIFFGMAGLFLLTVLVGFVPNSISILGEVGAGLRPALPPALHAHALLMGSWLLLLLAQTWLMATGRKGLHTKLGIAAFAVVPAMIVAGIIVVPTMIEYNWARMAMAPPDADPAQFHVLSRFLLSVFALQIAVGLLFATFVGIGLAARKRDPGMHKRMMILATAVPLAAAIDRMAFLPTTYPFSALSPPLYTVLWISPMLAWDLVRNRRWHRAYTIWFAIFVPTAMLVELLWWHPAWLEFSAGIFGVDLPA
ncbi:hypothetical protein [Aurantiacibacter hainanensis]|uniref:hypothetical protein n=1 Tax=Aurantiacibacter hainanensis TaxID=3076114 RepID=UPI0030C66AEB